MLFVIMDASTLVINGAVMPTRRFFDRANLTISLSSGSKFEALLCQILLSIFNIFDILLL